MSEQTNTPAPAPVVQFQTERNTIQWDIVLDAKARGENKGKPYLRPADVTKDNLTTAIDWLGSDMVCSIVNAKLALMGSNITEQATNELGVLNEELAQKYFAEFSTRGETKAELEERKENFVQQMLSVAADTSMDLTTKMAKMQELGKEINMLTDAIANKTRTRKSDEAPAADAAPAQ